MKKLVRLLVKKGYAPAGYEAEYPLETADYLIRNKMAEEISPQEKIAMKATPIVKISKGTK